MISGLTPAETEHLYSLIRSLADEGRAVVLITHKMADVVACADRVVVMRRGKVVDAALLAERRVDQLVRAMVGESEDSDDAPSHEAGAARLVVDGLGGGILRDVSFEVGRGEILGIAGVSGNGQRELAQCLAGLRKMTQGTVTLLGQDIAAASLRERIGLGLAYVPEERMRDGAIREFLFSHQDFESR